MSVEVVDFDETSEEEEVVDLTGSNHLSHSNLRRSKRKPQARFKGRKNEGYDELYEDSVSSDSEVFWDSNGELDPVAVAALPFSQQYEILQRQLRLQSIPTIFLLHALT